MSAATEATARVDEAPAGIKQAEDSYDKPREIETVRFPPFRAALPRMDGKVVAITGTTSGTGSVCAQHCAELGARVIVLNRASERGDKALLELQKLIPYPKVTQVTCDLMSFASVRQAAAQLRKELASTGLDVLCNNAGVCALKDEATVDGCDTQMQTNHLSHFLLTAEVWPLLEQAAELRGEARVVNHSSDARRGPPFEQKYMERNGGNLGGDKEVRDVNIDPNPFEGGRWMRYHQSKLANMVFTYGLRDRAVKANSKVKSLVAHPGMASTNMQVTTTKDGGMAVAFTKYVTGACQSMEDGTMGILRGCCWTEANTGDFYGPRGPHGRAHLLEPEEEEKLADEASREMLWEVSTRVTGGKFPF